MVSVEVFNTSTHRRIYDISSYEGQQLAEELRKYATCHFKDMAAPKAVGIDLGTTYSCVAVWQHNRIEVIVNDMGARITPSVVAFTTFERLLGNAARNQIATNAKNTIFDVKRLIGRRYTDQEVQDDIQNWPFTVVEGDTGQPLIQVDYKGETKTHSPEEISAMILTKMKSIAELYLGCSVNDAVITVPAYFSDSQRKATKDAAAIAGLNVLKLLNEPSAAAIAYGYRPEGPEFNEHKTIMVFDLGGGTFDVSIVVHHSGAFEVKAVGGDMHLGGEDFDNRLLKHCINHFNRVYRNRNPGLTSNQKSLRRLKAECERAKISLSSSVDTIIDIDSLYNGLDFRISLTRAMFEQINMDLFMKCIDTVKSCLEDARMRADDIDDVVLVGGSTRIPKVREMLQHMFPSRPLLCSTVNPDEAIAIGAALQAKNVNDEAADMVLVDVTPLSLGVSINGGIMSVIIPRNTPIPAEKERCYTTRFDNQTYVNFPVYEGERPLVANNNLLGQFRLTNISPARRGLPDLKVLFKIDENGILRVSARDARSGVRNEIVITNDGGRLTEFQIRRMIEEAERYRVDDEEAKRMYLAKNELHTFMGNTRMRLSTSCSGIDAVSAVRIMNKLDAVDDWLLDNEHPSVEEVRRHLQELRVVCHALSSE